MTHRLDAAPDTVHWGYFDAALKPVHSISLGDTIVISSVSGSEDELPSPSMDPVLQKHRRILDVVRPQLGPRYPRDAS